MYILYITFLYGPLKFFCQSTENVTHGPWVMAHYVAGIDLPI